MPTEKVPSNLADAVVVTVHGTFARGASWTRSDSALSRTLHRWFAGREHPMHLDTFEWSGRNAIAARQAAGRALAEHLDDIASAHPNARIYVVAHSHGGSVFAYAMKHRPALGGRVNGFVALATPWIGVEPSAHALALRSMLARLAIVAALGIGLLALAYLVQWVLLQSGALDIWGDTEIGRGARHQQVMQWVVLFSALAGLPLVPAQRMLAARRQRHAPAFAARLAARAQQMDTLHAPLPRSVFLKPTGDEAALALNWAGAMAALMRAGSGLLFRALARADGLWRRLPSRARTTLAVALSVAWCMGSVAVVDLMFALARGELPLRDALPALADLVHSQVNLLTYWDSGLLTWHSVLQAAALAAAVPVAALSWLAALLVATALALLLVVVMLAGWGFGAASLSSSLDLHVLVEATPVGRHELALVDVATRRARDAASATTPPQGSKTPLAHSAVYDHPAAISAVVGAIAGFGSQGRATTRSATSAAP